LKKNEDGEGVCAEALAQYYFVMLAQVIARAAIESLLSMHTKNWG